MLWECHEASSEFFFFYLLTFFGSCTITLSAQMLSGKCCLMSSFVQSLIFVVLRDVLVVFSHCLDKTFIKILIVDISSNVAALARPRFRSRCTARGPPARRSTSFGSPLPHLGRAKNRCDVIGLKLILHKEL